MAAFSTNQVRHLYVSKVLKSPKVISTDTAGSIAVKSDTAKSNLYFEYMGSGGITRSDLINTKSITAAKATDADAMAHKLTKNKLVLDPSINSGNPVSNQDYILKISFRNYIGLSEEDQVSKYGSVYTSGTMTASAFYKAMVLSLVKNFSKEEGGLLTFYLEVGGVDPAIVAGSPVEVTASTIESTLTGTYTGIVIEEKPQEWILGVFPQVPVNYIVQPSIVTSNGSEVIWGIVNSVTPTNKIDNGNNIADLEYFCMGERGDIYRNINFPNVIRTKYLVDPSLKYNTIDIHYSYSGSGENPQKSEKDITLVIPKIGATNSVSNKLTNDIILAVNTATGLTIPTLNVATS